MRRLQKKKGGQLTSCGGREEKGKKRGIDLSFQARQGEKITIRIGRKKDRGRPKKGGEPKNKRRLFYGGGEGKGFRGKRSCHCKGTTRQPQQEKAGLYFEELKREGATSRKGKTAARQHAQSWEKEKGGNGVVDFAEDFLFRHSGGERGKGQGLAAEKKKRRRCSRQREKKKGERWRGVAKKTRAHDIITPCMGPTERGKGTKKAFAEGDPKNRVPSHGGKEAGARSNIIRGGGGDQPREKGEEEKQSGPGAPIRSAGLGMERSAASSVGEGLCLSFIQCGAMKGGEKTEGSDAWKEEKRPLRSSVGSGNTKSPIRWKKGRQETLRPIKRIGLTTRKRKEEKRFLVGRENKRREKEKKHAMSRERKRLGLASQKIGRALSEDPGEEKKKKRFLHYKKGPRAARHFQKEEIRASVPKEFATGD